MKKIVAVLFLPIAFTLINSCSLTNVFDTSGNYDTGKDKVILDTLKNRKLAISNYARQIEMESSGKYTEINWIRNWRSAISALRAGGRENPEFYVSYIIKERRKKGLPEL